MGCSEGIKVDKVVVFCHLLFEIVFSYSLFVCLHCPGHSVCEIYENLFFSPCISALTLLPPLLYHSSVKHAVRFMPFALLGIEQKYREKTLWRTCEEDFQIHCTNNIYTNTHTHARTCYPFLFRSLRRWGELKYKDGRCSTSSENCNFCSTGSLGWQEIFHPRCHQHINKTSGAECSPSLSRSYTHTYTRARTRMHTPWNRLCAHMLLQNVYSSHMHVQMQIHNSVHEYEHNQNFPPQWHANICHENFMLYIMST